MTRVSVYVGLMNPQIPTCPTIHSNGSAASDLDNGYTDAVRALYHALDKMDNTAPNARDYDIIDFAAAEAEHAARVASVRTVLDTYTALVESVSA